MDADLFSTGDRMACMHAYLDWLTDIKVQPEGPRGPAEMRRNGRLGGVKRVARNRLIIAFCKELVFKDISLHTMKFAMRQLFGVAVAHEDLLAWATTGRKADSRVDRAQVLAVLDAGDVRARATARTALLDKQWKTVKLEAYAAAKRERAALVPQAAKPAKAKRGKPGSIPDMFEDIS